MAKMKHVRCALVMYMTGTLIEAARHGSVSRFIGRSRSEDSVCNTIPANNADNKGSASRSNSDEGVTASPTDSNPSMDKPDVNTAPTNNSSSTSAKYKTKDHHAHLYGSSVVIYHFSSSFFLFFF